MFRQLFEVIGWIKLHSGGSRKTIKEHLSLQKYFATRLHSNFLESFNLTQTCSGPTITTAVQRDALSGAYLCSHTRNSISGSRIKFERFHLPSSINGCLCESVWCLCLREITLTSDTIVIISYTS